MKNYFQTDDKSLQQSSQDTNKLILMRVQKVKHQTKFHQVLKTETDQYVYKASTTNYYKHQFNPRKNLPILMEETN